MPNYFPITPSATAVEHPCRYTNHSTRQPYAREVQDRATPPMRRQCARKRQMFPLHHHHLSSSHISHLKNRLRTKGCELRQHIITILCYLLRYLFALLELLRRPFRGRAWQNPRAIVVIKPCCLGDLVMTTPLLAIIRRAYPTASITYVAGT